MITIELFGVPRIRAGRSSVVLDASTLGQALRLLGRSCPTLEGALLDDGTPAEGYLVSLNGERFIADPATPLRPDDRLILLSADVGG